MATTSISRSINWSGRAAILTLNVYLRIVKNRFGAISVCRQMERTYPDTRTDGKTPNEDACKPKRTGRDEDALRQSHAYSLECSLRAIFRKTQIWFKALDIRLLL